MGVPGLWPILGQAGTLHNLETLDLSAVTDGDGADTTRLPVVGVDISAWLYHARLSVEGSNPMLRLIFFRLARLLSLPIHVVFVFDGPLRPRIKRGRTVGAGKHPLTGPLMEMIAAFGGVGWEAPGEAEAELSRMNCEGLIDAVLSDDVDSLVFGARAIMRNWSATLSGSKSAAAPSSDEHGDNSVTIYKASHIQDLPDLGLDREGLILVALLAGGDYDVKGLGGCGAKIAVALAQAGHGSPLVAGFKAHCKITGHDPNTNLPTVSTSSTWPAFLEDWLSDVREELATNKQGFLHNKQHKLSRSDDFAALLGTPEAIEVLASYIHPVTTWSVAEEGAVAGSSCPATRPPRRLKFKEPNMKAAATYAQRTFAWGPKATVGRMRNVIWKGLLVREMRRLQLAEAQVQSTDNDTLSRYPLVTIHSERRHPATGNLLEYRVEWDPTPLAKAAQEGIDPLLNVGPGFDEPYPDDYVPPAGSAPTVRVQSPMSAGNSEADDSTDEDERPPRSPYELVLAAGPDAAPPSPKKRNARPPPDPFTTLRSWILAERLELCGVGKTLVQDFKHRLANKGKPGSKKRALPRPMNQPAIDCIFAADKGGPSSRAAASASKSVLGTSPPTARAPTYRQTHLPFAGSGSRTFGRTQSGPAASASSDVERQPLGRRERAGSFDTLLEESFTMVSDSEGEDERDGDGFEHLRAVQSKSRVPLAEKRPAAGEAVTTRTTTRSTQSKSRSRSLTATQFNPPTTTTTQRKRNSRSPVLQQSTGTIFRPAPTRRPREVLSSSPPPGAPSSDLDDSLPDAAEFIRQARAQVESRRSGAVKAVSSTAISQAITLSPSPRRPTASSKTTQLSPSPRRPSSSKRPRNAAALPFMPAGKATAKPPARPLKPKGPPIMYPSSSPVDLSSSPPSVTTAPRRKGGRKSDAIVLSDSD